MSATGAPWSSIQRAGAGNVGRVTRDPTGLPFFVLLAGSHRPVPPRTRAARRGSAEGFDHLLASQRIVSEEQRHARVGLPDPDREYRRPEFTGPLFDVRAGRLTHPASPERRVNPDVVDRRRVREEAVRYVRVPAYRRDVPHLDTIVDEQAEEPLIGPLPRGDASDR
jgi:hypothetical protein